MQTLKERKDAIDEIVGGINKSCLNCIHMPICSIYRGELSIVNAMENETQEKPFEAHDVAQICKHYTLATIGGGV